MRILILFFIVTISNAVYSQFRNDPPVKFGITQSVNYFTLLGDPVITEVHTSDMGYRIGAGLGFRLGNGTFFNLGVYYANSQTKNYVQFIDANTGRTGKTKLKYYFYYIHFPLIVQRYIGNRFFVTIGPQISILNDIKLRDHQVVSTIPSTLETNRIDYGLSAGIGRSFMYDAKNELFIEIRDQYGFFNTGSKSYPSYTTNTIEISVGWLYYL